MKKKPKGWKFWVGWVLTALPSFALLMSGVMKLIRHPEVLKNMVERFGYPDSTVVAVGVVEVLCMVLYVAPPTSVLGAVLVTGYLGGAVATHVRAGDGAGDVITPILLGVMAWAALFLRDERLRSLLPLRKPAATPPGA